MSEHADILNLILKGVDGINSRLDAQNGRVRKAESAIAVLRWAVFGGGVGSLGVIGAALWYLIILHMGK